MKLLTEELRRRLPPLYSQENTKDPTAVCKFFTADSNWTWFVTEGSEEDGDFRFFGYVIGLDEEWGYFCLSELESTRGPLGLPIERDLYFKPGPFSEVIKRYRAERGQGAKKIITLTPGKMLAQVLMWRWRERCCLPSSGAERREDYGHIADTNYERRNPMPASY